MKRDTRNMMERPKRKVSTGGILNNALPVMVAMIVTRNRPAITASTVRTSLELAFRVTVPDRPPERSTASKNTVIEAGMASVSSVRISTLSARKIISVVTSPVISETPPEFTANTTKTINCNRFFRSRLKERIREQETSVAVMLSAREENTKQNRPVRNSNRRSVT